MPFKKVNSAADKNQKSDRNKNKFDTIRVAFNQAVEMKQEPIDGEKKGRYTMNTQSNDKFTLPKVAGFTGLAGVAGIAVLATGAYVLWRNRERIMSTLQKTGDAIQHSEIGERLLNAGEKVFKGKMGASSNKEEFGRKPEKTAH